MTREQEKVREWLGEYRDIQERIRTLKHMADERRKDLLYCLPGAGVPGEGGHTGTVGSPTERKAEQRELAVLRYEKEIRGLYRELEAREALVGRLRGEAYQFFTRYYLVGERITWERLAEEMGCSVRHTYDVRRQSLKKLAIFHHHKKSVQ